MSEEHDVPLYTTLRPPLAIADPTGGIFSYSYRHTIEILHPGYTGRRSILLTLHAPDLPEGGLYYDVAHQAAAIVTGNRFEGYFTDTPFGDRIHIQANAILKPGRYYFHTGDCCDSTSTPTHTRYPVVPSFQSWQFPHDDLPQVWVSAMANLSPEYDRGAEFSNTSGAVASRDKTCRVTAATLGVEAAHICPRKCDEWFHWNMMEQYNRRRIQSAPAMVDDLSNLMLLRADVHDIFDSWRLTFFPKISEPGETDGSLANAPKLVTHALEAHKELVICWHNRQLLEIRGLAPQHLFTRFAFCIFGLLEGFMSCGVKRDVLIPTEAGDPKLETWTAADYYKMLAATRSRSQSLKKRKASEPEAETQTLGDYDAIRCNKRRRRNNSDGFQEYSRSPKRRALFLSPQAFPSSDVSSESMSPAQYNPDIPFIIYDGEDLGREGHRNISRFNKTAIEENGLDTKSGCETSSTRTPATLKALAAKHLEDERRRSDPKDNWTQQCVWAQYKLERTMTSKEAAMVWSILGGEELEEE